MKKIKNYALLIMVALGTSMSFVACSDDNENNDDGKPVSMEFKYNPDAPLQLCFAAQNHSEEEVHNLLTKAGFVMREIYGSTDSLHSRNYTLHKSGHFEAIEYRTSYNTETKTWESFGYYIDFDSLTDIKTWVNTHAANVRVMQAFVTNPTEVEGTCGIKRITGNYNTEEELVAHSTDNFSSYLSNLTSIASFTYLLNDINDTMQAYFQPYLMCRFTTPTTTGGCHGHGGISREGSYFMLLGEVSLQNTALKK